MCTYNIKIDDAVMEDVRPSITQGMAEDAWVQLQVEMLFTKLAASRRQEVFANARKAIAAMRKQSEINGNSRMSLDDINSEIREARAARKK